MDIKHFKYTQELIKTKATLKNQLKFVSKEIEESQQKCDHIMVDFGYLHCILCGKVNYDIDKKNIIELSKEYGNLDRVSEYEYLRNKAIELINNNENITREELIKELKR